MRRVSVKLSEETVSLNVEGEPVVGIDLRTGTIGHWPDGEQWVALATLPRLATFDPAEEQYDHSRARRERRNAHSADLESQIDPSDAKSWELYPEELE